MSDWNRTHQKITSDAHAVLKATQQRRTVWLSWVWIQVWPWHAYVFLKVDVAFVQQPIDLSTRADVVTLDDVINAETGVCDSHVRDSLFLLGSKF